MQRNELHIAQLFMAVIGFGLLYIQDAFIAFVGLLLIVIGSVGPLLFVVAQGLDRSGRNLTLQPGTQSSAVDGLKGISWLYARRMFLWWCTGLTVFALFFVFVAIRIFIFDPERLAIGNVITTPGAVSFGGIVALVIPVFSLPLGYLLHQMHVAAYWSRILPIRFTKIDRAYDALMILKKELSIREEFFERPIIPAAFPRHPLLSHFLGHNVQYVGIGFSIPEPIRIAQVNIENLDTLWRKLAQRASYLGVAQQHVIQLNEDMYVAVGVTRLSVWVAYGVYALYELALWRAGHISTNIGGLSVLIATLITLALFWSLNRVRTLRGKNGIDLIVQGVREIVREYPTEAREVLTGAHAPVPPDRGTGHLAAIPAPVRF